MIALDGRDLHGSWNAEGRLVLFSAMTHRGKHTDAALWGQIRVPEGTTETTGVRTLLNPIDITGALVTADAANTCADTVVEDNKANYLPTIKANRSSLPAAAIGIGRKLIGAVPAHLHTERGHGRINRWTTWSTGISEQIGLSGAFRIASSAGTSPTWTDSRSVVVLVLTSRAR
ncbi:hypothetical protein GWI34_05500 [Actinomadura sp. DSM 109109]|nr:hypothetical protein [Actinomadura lepetitiana]